MSCAGRSSPSLTYVRLEPSRRIRELHRALQTARFHLASTQGGEALGHRLESLGEGYVLGYSWCRDSQRTIATRVCTFREAVEQVDAKYQHFQLMLGRSAMLFLRPA